MLKTVPEPITSYLARRLEKGSFRLGQLLVSPDFGITHVDDAGRKDLAVYSNPHDAIEIAKYDEEGKYRPLKTAPNLRRGWRLKLKDIRDLLLALDFLYPAAIGTALAMERDECEPVNFRTTLERQTGMYAVVKKITDEQANRLISEVCQKGCLRRIRWSLDQGKPPPFAGERTSPASEIPLFCVEACNILVAAGRAMVKKDKL